MTSDFSGGVPARRHVPEPEGHVPKYKQAWRWWLGKSTIIARKQNRVFSWLAYHLGMRWVGLYFRWTKQDRLDRAVQPVGDSGWKEREGPIHTDPERVRRPF